MTPAATTAVAPPAIRAGVWLGSNGSGPVYSIPIGLVHTTGERVSSPVVGFDVNDGEHPHGATDTQAMRKPRKSASPGRNTCGRERKRLSTARAIAMNQRYSPKLKMVRSPRATMTSGRQASIESWSLERAPRPCLHYVPVAMPKSLKVHPVERRLLDHHAPPRESRTPSNQRVSDAHPTAPEVPVCSVFRCECYRSIMAGRRPRSLIGARSHGDAI